MNNHLDLWLDAYLDGELRADQRTQTEVHLAGCTACQGKIDQRRLLGAALAELPPVSRRSSPEQFNAAVLASLPKRPPKSSHTSRWLRLAWQLTPLGLLASLAFIETVALLSGLVYAIPIMRAALLRQAATLSLFAAPQPMGGLFDLSGIASAIDWNWPDHLISLLAISTIYLAWLVFTFQHNKYRKQE